MWLIPKKNSLVSHSALGYGGIELGLELAGIQFKRVIYVERECYAAANLAHKIETGELAPGVIHTDVKTFPYSRFRGLVDIVLAGFPCQPFSAAGQRQGTADPRHLWPHIADGIAACRPGIVFAENVEGHVTLGLRDVLSDLGRMGYRTTFGIFSAAEVGASHQRKRVFILGDRDNSIDWSTQEPVAVEWPARPGQPQHDWEEPRTVADPIAGNVEAGRGRRRTVREESSEGGSSSDAASSGEDCGDGKRQAESKLVRTAHGSGCGVDATACQMDRLRLLGNGVVPATAAKAWVELIKQLK